MSINNKLLSITILLIALIICAITTLLVYKTGVNTSTLICETLFTLLMLIYTICWFKINRLNIMEDIVRGIISIFIYRLLVYWHMFLICSILGIYLGFIVCYIIK